MLRTGQIGQVRTGKVTTGQGKIRLDRSGKDRAGKERSGQVSHHHSNQKTTLKQLGVKLFVISLLESLKEGLEDSREVSGGYLECIRMLTQKSQDSV